ncbi:hypothetical protein PWT90_06648 [Aphanocladium album]|nr:hypothetical protein PWT90_06648 [Aphanocladium album]
MRYEDWDILLFPRDGKVPLKEFKVACHVVQDNGICAISSSLQLPNESTELSHLPGSLGGLPTVCCFVPSLAPDISGTGELDTLKFPNFQQELLNQSYWSPADDLGRIKVVISEGYTRESTMTFERLKNIVAFSFQHAPLEILESSAIAWPNNSMWRNMPFTASTSLPTRQLDGGRSHAHSPRPRNSSGHACISLAAEGLPGARNPQALRYREELKAPSFSFLDSLPSSSTVAPDPFVESHVYLEWLNGIDAGLDSGPHSTMDPHATSRALRKSSTDISMPDYVSWTQTPPLRESQHEDSAAMISSESDATHMKVPTNTPTACNLSATGTEGIHFTIVPGSTPISVGWIEPGNSSLLSHSATISPQLLPTPAMEVKSRKENKAKQISTPPSVSAMISITGEPVSVRKVSQQLFKAGSLVMKASPTSESPSRHASAEKSGKRVRTFTPTSAKVFEDDEEPLRASPRIRLSAAEDAAAK